LLNTLAIYIVVKAVVVKCRKGWIRKVGMTIKPHKWLPGEEIFY